jgi:hypothetical protein
MRQPDIEIYIKDADQAAVSAWLEKAIGPCSEWRAQGETVKCTAGSIPVTWLPKAVGKWNSLFLDSDKTPWDDDVACARDACAALDVEVRCAPGSWSEDQGEEDADRWLKVTAAGIEEITWRTG